MRRELLDQLRRRPNALWTTARVATITGLPPMADDAMVFHAGTERRADGALVTHRGRVLCITALGDTVKAAQQRAYAVLAPIRFDGAQYRSDIGHRALKPR